MTMSTAPSGDAQLLADIAAGEPFAFKTLVTRYYASFIAMALANNLSLADAEEAVGDAFMKIWHSAGRYRDQGIEPKYWLRTLMRHALIDRVRSLQRFAAEQSATRFDADGEFAGDAWDDGAALDAATAPASPLELLESAQAAACFDACLASLSDEHRGTLQQCLLAGQTELEVATATRLLCTIGAVLDWIYRSHVALSKGLIFATAIGIVVSLDLVQLDGCLRAGPGWTALVVATSFGSALA